MANYDDIINLEHPTSAKHKRMSNIERAAQFSPFMALTGYEAAVTETARLTDSEVELDEDSKKLLDEKMRLLLSTDGEYEASFTYFVHDTKKSGGAYVSTTGKIKKYDEFERTIKLEDSTVIQLDRIIDVRSRIFEFIDE